MSGRPQYKKTQLMQEDNLLEDLNIISDFCIGNESPQDVAFNERNTLPDILAYAITYPESPKAVNDAVNKVKQLEKLVVALRKKLDMMEYKIQLKKPKSWK